MYLEEKSEKLKLLVSTYDSKWFLGDLSFVMHSGRERAFDQIGKLSSPMRQLYYLAGLNISTDNNDGIDYIFNKDKWDEIVKLLNEIELEYQKILVDNTEDETIENWKKIRDVAIPSFLTYFNVGPLNFEEQSINWVSDLFSNFDELLLKSYGLKTQDFITFYENLDNLVQKNFQGHSTNSELLRKNWADYTFIKSGMDESLPDFFKNSIPKSYIVQSKFMIDKGMKDRFYPNEIISEVLPLEKVKMILNLISTKREKRDFLYYTETSPGNPIYDYPIIEIGEGMYQVFEVKQVIHAINNLLEKKITEDETTLDKHIKLKGDLLENNILTLFRNFFGEGIKAFKGYYVDEKEQDILIIWNAYAFIIEAKGYNLREPFRTPEKAYPRIKDDFNKCIGYGYEQTHRIEKIIQEEEILIIKDEHGKILEEIETAEIEESFSIIVNLNSFGLIQNDLSYLLKIEEDEIYPWAVKFDDLEIFILTLLAKHKRPEYFINFLLFREELHGKITCSDELEICGGYLTKQINPKKLKYLDHLPTKPEYGDIFDKQYRKGMGFRNERFLYEKQIGKYLFW